MMSRKMQDAFNEQLQHEFYSSFLYLSMSTYGDRVNLPDLARWMRAQRGGAAAAVSASDPT